MQEQGQIEQQIIDNVAYSPLKQIEEINYHNGTISQITYDINEAYRLTQKETVTPTTTLQDLTYAYDSVGNIIQITDTAPNQLAKTTTFSYDDLYRLTNASIIDNYTPTTTLETYTFDPIGNITSKSDIGAYSYNNDNPYQASSINGQAYTYDLNGNLTNDGSRTMSYNYQDMMSGVIVDGRTMNYYYDHSKTRVVKHNPQSGYIKFYPNKYFEKETTGEKTKYVFLGNQRIAIIDNEGTHLNFSDHLNSSSVTTDLNGIITNLIDYLPFGSDRVNVQLGNYDPENKFTGQKQDNESDLYYYGARYYEAATGRFTQADPIAQNVVSSNKLQEVLVEPQRLNEYSYALNNPIRYVDPDGQMAETPFDVLVAALSLLDYVANPTWGNAIFLGLDAIGAASPGLPSIIGYARHGSQAAKILTFFYKMASKVESKTLEMISTFAKNILFKQNRLKFAAGKDVGHSLANLSGHFVKHKDQFNVKTLEEYYNKANDFIDNNVFDNKGKFFTWAEEGDTVFYNSETKELLAKTPDNEIRTYHVVNTDEKLTKVNNKVAEIKYQQNGQ